MGDRSEARLGRRIVLCLAALNLVACATLGDPPPTLYKRLGGREGIALVVGDFVTNMAGDRRVNARFKDMKGPDVEKLKSNLADQICDATGGPRHEDGAQGHADHRRRVERDRREPG